MLNTNPSPLGLETWAQTSSRTPSKRTSGGAVGELVHRAVTQRNRQVCIVFRTHVLHTHHKRWLTHHGCSLLEFLLLCDICASPSSPTNHVFSPRKPCWALDTWGPNHSRELHAALALGWTVCSVSGLLRPRIKEIDSSLSQICCSYDLFIRLKS